MELLEVEPRDKKVDRAMGYMLENNMDRFVVINPSLNHHEVSMWLLGNIDDPRLENINTDAYKYIKDSLTREIPYLETNIDKTTELLKKINTLKKNLEEKQKQQEGKENLKSGGGFRQSKKSKRKSNKTKNVKRLRSRRNKK
jgi:hypothetical protein